MKIASNSDRLSHIKRYLNVYIPSTLCAECVTEFIFTHLLKIVFRSLSTFSPSRFSFLSTFHNLHLFNKIQCDSAVFFFFFSFCNTFFPLNLSLELHFWNFQHSFEWKRKYSKFPIHMHHIYERFPKIKLKMRLYKPTIY